MDNTDYSGWVQVVFTINNFDDQVTNRQRHRAYSGTNTSTDKG